MTKKIQQTTVKAIFKKGNNILFVKNTKGVWELPGGRVEFGENPVGALEREIKEELGWNNIKIGEIINVWDFTSQYNNSDYQFIVLVYECFSKEKDITANEEYIDYQWIPTVKVKDLKMRDGYKISIKKFFNKHKS